MNKIEKIRKEIERLKGAVTATIKELKMDEPSERMRGELDAYDDILYFLDSLQQERQDVDLEKEIDNVIADYSFTKTIDSGGFKTTVLDYAKIARHFYELGKNSK